MIKISALCDFKPYDQHIEIVGQETPEEFIGQKN